MRSLIVSTLLGGLLAAAGAATAATERENAQHERYSRYAGAPVEDMPFWSMRGFETLGDYSVLVWTEGNKAWMIDVLPPCSDLAFANSIGLTSTLHKVSAKFDYVLAKRDRCKIKSIQPVDYKAYQAAMRAEREAKKAQR